MPGMHPTVVPATALSDNESPEYSLKDGLIVSCEDPICIVGMGMHVLNLF